MTGNTGSSVQRCDEASASNASSLKSASVLLYVTRRLKKERWRVLRDALLPGPRAVVLPVSTQRVGTGGGICEELSGADGDHSASAIWPPSQPPSSAPGSAPLAVYSLGPPGPGRWAVGGACQAHWAQALWTPAKRLEGEGQLPGEALMGHN